MKAIERRRLEELRSHERLLEQVGVGPVAGVDEVGMGPLAGPVVAAAVILPSGPLIEDLDDSKTLTRAVRERVETEIRRVALAISIGVATVEEIDSINIFRAALLAMRRAVESLSVAPHEAWIDGSHCPDLACRAKAIVDGDALHKVISAASILAKTARDAEMRALHGRFPQYGFDQHKGYATAEHLEALGRAGPCDIHRRSFYAIGVFYEKDLFSDSWASLPEQLRIRSYRLYCEAVKLCAEKKLALFDAGNRRLKREFADVIAAREAAAYVERARLVLRKARLELRERGRG